MIKTIGGSYSKTYVGYTTTSMIELKNIIKVKVQINKAINGKLYLKKFLSKSKLCLMNITSKKITKKEKRF